MSLFFEGVGHGLSSLSFTYSMRRSLKQRLKLPNETLSSPSAALQCLFCRHVVLVPAGGSRVSTPIGLFALVPTSCLDWLTGFVLAFILLMFPESDPKYSFIASMYFFTVSTESRPVIRQRGHAGFKESD